MTNAPYFIRGANLLSTDSKQERWAKRLIAYQQGASAAKKYDYKRGDTCKRILTKLASSVYGQSISILMGVQFGTGEPEDAPAAPWINRKVYVQRDSVPPWKVWVWDGSEWS